MVCNLEQKYFFVSTFNYGKITLTVKLISVHSLTTNDSTFLCNKVESYLYSFSIITSLIFHFTESICKSQQT